MKGQQNLGKRKASTRGRQAATKRRRTTPETQIKEEHCTEINIKVEVLECTSEVSEPLRDESLTRKLETTKLSFVDNSRPEIDFRFDFGHLDYPLPNPLDGAYNLMEGYIDEPSLPYFGPESNISKTF